MSRTVAVLRCSTLNQDQEMLAQRADIERWCEQNDVTIAPEDWRLEPDVSGKAKVRTELQRVVDECREDKVHRVVFADFQRAGRRGAATCIMLEELAEWGVDLVFVRSGPLDMTTYQGRAWALIYAAMGLLKLEEVSRSTTAGMASAKARGVTVGRPGAFYAPEVFAEVQAARAAGVTWKRIAATYTACRRRWVPDAPGSDGSPSKSGRWEVVNGAKLDAKQAKAAFRRTTP